MMAAQDAAAVRAVRASSEPARTPDCEEDVDGSGFKPQCTQSTYLAKYDELCRWAPCPQIKTHMIAPDILPLLALTTPHPINRQLERLGDYELLTITDEIMGINPSSSAFAKSKARAAYRLQLALPHTDLYLHLFRSGGPRDLTPFKSGR